MLVLTEGFWAGSHEAESVLKALIMEPEIAIERKGVDVRFVPSYTRVMMTSNAEWVVPGRQRHGSRNHRTPCEYPDRAAKRHPRAETADNMLRRCQRRSVRR